MASAAAPLASAAAPSTSVADPVVSSLERHQGNGTNAQRVSQSASEAGHACRGEVELDPGKLETRGEQKGLTQPIMATGLWGCMIYTRVGGWGMKRARFGT
jgi:hypothetical protein